MSKRGKAGQRLAALWARADVLLILLTLVLAVLLMVRFGNVPAEAEFEQPTPLNTAPAVVVQEEPQQPIPEQGRPVRFLMYNVQNYFVPGESSRSRFVSRAKSEKARKAVAAAIAEARPEIVGLIEIGGKLALQDLQERLGEHGLDYRHSYVLERRGEDRALALLSMHPIERNDSVADKGLFGDHKRKMLRGILDVTVGLDDGRRFRIVGVHLKSRVAVNADAADSLRRREVRTVADYLHILQTAQPDIPLLVFGDWNDGPADGAMGILGKLSGLTRVKAEDSRGQCWTIYYDNGKGYFVFDQIFVNSVMQKRLGKRSKSGIVDCEHTNTASDHRPVWCDLR